MRSQQDLRLSLLCTALLAAMAVPAVAQDKGQSEATGKTTTLDKVTVTGSRIKRTDLEEETVTEVLRILKSELDK